MLSIRHCRCAATAVRMLALMAAAGPVAAQTADSVRSRTATGSARVSRDGLVASYDMSTLVAGGLLRDFSGNALHARIEGTTTAAGVGGGALAFGSATDRILLPATRALDLNGPLTLVVRFRYDRRGQHQHLLAFDDKFAMWLTPEDRFRFVNTLGDGLESTVAVAPSDWHVAIGVFGDTAGAPLDSANVALWLDGRRVPAQLVTRTPEQPFRWQRGKLYESDACHIGFESHQGEPTHRTLAFYGVIDDVLIFRRGLTLDEIRVLSSAITP